uniref:hypothetical protein n=1 Tax=Actinokineospora sp. CA-119265 TaxID=3239890 RepID=UPI003F492036
MDPLTLSIAVAWWLTRLATEVPYAVRGKTSPRMELKLAKEKNKTAATEKGAAAHFFSALWEDSWDGATDLRRRHRANRARRRSEGTLWWQQAAALWRDTTGSRGWTAQRTPPASPGAATPPKGPRPAAPGDAAPPPPSPGPRPAPDPAPPTGGQPEPDPENGPQPENPPPPPHTPPPRAASSAGERPQDPPPGAENTPPPVLYATAERLDTPTAAPAPGPTPAPALAREPLRLGPATSSDLEENTVSEEFVNIPGFIRHAHAAAAAAASGITSMEAFLSSLANGEVTGEAVTLSQSTLELLTRIHGLWEAMADALTEHLQIGEAYAAAPDAGNKAFNTLD